MRERIGKRSQNRKKKGRMARKNFAKKGWESKGKLRMLLIGGAQERPMSSRSCWNLTPAMGLVSMSARCRRVGTYLMRIVLFDV